MLQYWPLRNTNLVININKLSEKSTYSSFNIFTNWDNVSQVNSQWTHREAWSSFLACMKTSRSMRWQSRSNIMYEDFRYHSWFSTKLVPCFGVQWTLSFRCVCLNYDTQLKGIRRKLNGSTRWFPETFKKKLKEWSSSKWLCSTGTKK